MLILQHRVWRYFNKCLLTELYAVLMQPDAGIHFCQTYSRRCKDISHHSSNLVAHFKTLRKYVDRVRNSPKRPKCVFLRQTERRTVSRADPSLKSFHKHAGIRRGPARERHGVTARTQIKISTKKASRLNARGADGVNSHGADAGPAPLSLEHAHSTGQ